MRVGGMILQRSRVFGVVPGRMHEASAGKARCGDETGGIGGGLRSVGRRRLKLGFGLFTERTRWNAKHVLDARSPLRAGASLAIQPPIDRPARCAELSRSCGLVPAAFPEFEPHQAGPFGEVSPQGASQQRPRRHVHGGKTASSWQTCQVAAHRALDLLLPSGRDCAQVKTLAERVAAAMEARGFNQVDLEQAAGLPRGYASRILSGKRRYLRPEQLQRLAEGLAVNYQWLATGEGDMAGTPDAPPPPTPERWVEKPVRYENLRKVVTSMRGTRPDAFLDEVLLNVALYSPTDLPEASWKAMLDGLYAEWRGKAVPEPLEDDPVAEAMAEARKKAAKKRGGGE